jgi:hypothetical protein
MQVGRRKTIHADALDQKAQNSCSKEKQDENGNRDRFRALPGSAAHQDSHAVLLFRAASPAPTQRREQGSYQWRAGGR